MSAATVPQYAAQLAAHNSDATRTPQSIDDRLGEVHHGDIASITPDPFSANPHQPKTPNKMRRQLQAAASAAGQQHVDDSQEVQLRTAVLDALSLFATIEEDANSRTASTTRRAGESNIEVLDKVTEFDSNFVYRNYVGFDVEKVVAENSCHTDLPFQKRFGSRIVIPEDETFNGLLTELREFAVPPHSALYDEFKHRIEKTVTKPMFPLGDQNVPSILLSVNEFAMTDVLANVMREQEELMKALQDFGSRIAALEGEIEGAKRAEDFLRVDQLEAELVDVSKQRYDMLAARLRSLTSGGGEGSDGLQSRLDAVMNAPSVARLREQTKDLLAKAQSDLTTLEEDRQRRIRFHDNTIAQYNATVERSKESLRQNYQQQEQLWKEIQERLEMIHSLGVQAKDSVHHHMQKTEIEQKRRKEHSEYLDSNATLSAYCEKLVASRHSAHRFLNQVESYIQFGRDAIEGMRVSERLKALISSTRTELDGAFHHYGTKLVGRVHVWDVRVTQSARRIEDLKFQQKAAVETDDPALPAYVAQTNQLAQKMEKQTDRKDELEAMLFEAQSNYASIMDQLDDDDDNDDGGASGENNPLVLIQQARAERRSKFVGELEEFVAGQEESNAALKTEVQAQSQQAQTGRHEWTEKRNNSQRRTQRQQTILKRANDPQENQQTTVEPDETA